MSKPWSSQTSTSPLHIALVEPEIPPNTGNIARLCAATRTPLHLIGQLGFRTDDKMVRRAGLDYWPLTDIRYHKDVDEMVQSLPESRLLFLTTKAEKSYLEIDFRANDCLVFGRETAGLPMDLLKANWENCLTIPMSQPGVRSLNLATSVAIALYEALRQLRYWNP
jgi:tRNA (cytidine/uridine-2'-O-)-methyltransferase